MQHEIEILENNLQTLFIDLPGNPSGTAQIWWRAGSALESKDNEGIAHFLEHMFFKGTPQRPGAEIAHEVESFGGEINAFTSFDYTCYYINTPNTRLNQTVDILLDMVSNPTFKTEDLLPERDVVFEEYRRSIDNPNQFSFTQLQKGCFTGGYQHPILGREDTIKNFTREQLIEFRNDYYNLSNALLVVAGDLSNKKEIIETIENFKLPKGNPSHFPEFKLQEKTSAAVHNKEVRMCQIYLTIQAPHFSSSEAAVEDLAFNSLGHGESSRLYQSLVVENSLANGSGCSTMFMNKGGIHFLRISFPPENLNKILSKLESTLKNTLNEGFQEFEIKKIKNQYLASKIYEKESIETVAFSLGNSYAQTGDISSEDHFIAKIKQASSSAVNESLRQAFMRPLHLNMQVPLNVNRDNALKSLDGFLKKFEKFQQSLKRKKRSIPGTAKSKFDPQVQVVPISDGINLLYRQNKMNPTFVMHAYIKGGITEENSKNNGSYHLISTLLPKGHHKKTYKNLKLDLDNFSASFSGFSGKNAYGLTMHGQTEHFNSLSNDFIQSLLYPSMGAKFFSHEKKIALRHLETQKEDPIKICFQEVGNLMFKDHPYSLNAVGTTKSVKSLNRNKIIELHQKNIRNKEILISYCGDLDLEKVIETFSPHLKTLKSRKSKKAIKKKITPLKGKQHFVKFEREQTQIFHGIPTKSMDSKDQLILKMITTHLSGQSSELFVEVRDRKGLCYSAQPIHFAAVEGGYWGIYMASGHDKVPAAINAIVNIIQRLKEDGLNEHDFQRIKNMIDGQEQLNIQTNEDYANIYSIPFLHGHGIDYYHKKSRAIRNLDYENFQKSIKRIFNGKWNTVVVGRQG